MKPAGKLELLGATSIDSRTASVTVTVVVPATPPTCATSSAMPGETPVASPLALPVFETVAMPGLLVDHVARSVKSSVVPSEKVAVAVSCTSNPAGTVGFTGVTPIDTRVASDTVTEVDPSTPSRLAVMVEDPGATPVSCPRLPAALDTVAIPGLLVVHVACSVTSRLVPSE